MRLLDRHPAFSLQMYYLLLLYMKKNGLMDGRPSFECNTVIKNRTRFGVGLTHYLLGNLDAGIRNLATQPLTWENFCKFCRFFALGCFGENTIGSCASVDEAFGGIHVSVKKRFRGRPIRLVKVEENAIDHFSRSVENIGDNPIGLRDNRRILLYSEFSNSLCVGKLLQICGSLRLLRREHYVWQSFGGFPNSRGGSCNRGKEHYTSQAQMHMMQYAGVVRSKCSSSFLNLTKQTWVYHQVL